MESTKITVATTVKRPVDDVWELWTQPEHITNWNFASDDWHCPQAQNDLQEGGTFTARMEAKDGSMGFDFSGVYQEIILHKQIRYSLDDGREVEITFEHKNESTPITETFEADDSATIEQQQTGWQSILNNFKKYAESLDA